MFSSRDLRKHLYSKGYYLSSPAPHLLRVTDLVTLKNFHFDPESLEYTYQSSLPGVPSIVSHASLDPLYVYLEDLKRSGSLLEACSLFRIPSEFIEANLSLKNGCLLSLLAVFLKRNVYSDKSIVADNNSLYMYEANELVKVFTEFDLTQAPELYRCKVMFM